MTDRIGQQLGNYTITRLLGRGGFADVYLGEHLYLKTQAAIKILQTRLSSSDSMDGFLKEAQMIARLSHPNIIRVLDFGVDQEIPYLVMEYAANGTLRHHHTKNQALPLSTIVPYAKQVADALQYAHDERLIHRDVKPENMLLGRRNEVLLSDFGIALATQNSHSQHTQDAIGTVIYMSPEQIQGKPRPASDQYSLAIIIYEWLTGNPPFQGSFIELCTQHMVATPTPLSLKIPQISPSVEQVVMRGLHKDPKQRYPRIIDFAQELEQASQGGPLKQFPSSSPYTSSYPPGNEQQHLAHGLYTTAAMAGNGEALAHLLMQKQQTPPPGNVPPMGQGASLPPDNYIATPGNPGTIQPETPQQVNSHKIVLPPPRPEVHHPNTSRPSWPQQNQQQQSHRAQPLPPPPRRIVPLSQPAAQPQPGPHPSAMGNKPASEKQQQSEESLSTNTLIQLLLVVGGIILFCLLYTFRPVMWSYVVPVVLAVPMFFGGAFNRWTGLLVGVGGSLCSSLFFGYDILNATLFQTIGLTYEPWFPPLIYGLTGLIAGLPLRGRGKNRYPTLSSAIGSTQLTGFTLAIIGGILLFRANQLIHFMIPAIPALLALGTGMIAIMVYSIIFGAIRSN